MFLTAGIFSILASVLIAQIPPLQPFRDDNIERYIPPPPSSASLLSYSSTESRLIENLLSTIESSIISLNLKSSSIIDSVEKKYLRHQIFESTDSIIPKVSSSPIEKANGPSSKSTLSVATGKSSAVIENIDDGILYPTGVEMMPVAPTKLFPNMHGEYPQFDDDFDFFSATTQTEYFGPNGQISYGPPEIVSMPSSLRAFKSCIFGCRQVTIPVTSTGTVGSTVIIVLPFTIPCSLVSCPPCNTCVSSTISITVCPTITTTTPPPITATVFSFRSLTSSSSSQPIVTETVTVTRTRMPINCPTNCRHHHKSDYIDDSTDEKRFPIMTMQVDNHNSICSTYVICSPRHFTCPACHHGKTVDFGSVQSLLNQPVTFSDFTQSTSITTTSSISLGDSKVGKVKNAESSDDKSSDSSSSESSKSENKEASTSDKSGPSKFENKEASASDKSSSSKLENKGESASDKSSSPKFENKEGSTSDNSSSSSSSDSSLEKLRQKIEPNSIKNGSYRLAPSIYYLIGLFLLLITL